ncbi:hypothetical protein F511_01717 [Dorcoceras hygrometricum]|uniref:RBR-type E3 ubiquitin transferase n=1 Tax=Dorcoceras hygrometricum TaxID=472368 RepID=A0A2Z7AQY0_9LAMI|nr:hypothetical protein F511_01717 [Dorcoceras hygrometricum]
MDSDDRYHRGRVISELPIKKISGVEEMEEETEDHGGDEESDGGYPILIGHQKNFTILKVKDILQRQLNDILWISNVLRVSRFESLTLLCYYNWDVDRIHEEWFRDEQKVRISVGILDTSSIKRPIWCPNTSFLCNICCESLEGDQIRWAICGHPFCVQCWKTYISVSVKDRGIGCLRLRCPYPSCDANVGITMIHNLGSGSDYNRYQNYLFRSYVEGSRKRKWCPAPGCINATEYEAGISESYDVKCDCGHKFCWNCTDEAHRPLGCNMVAKWYEKSHDEGENLTWIKAFTKPCPKCNQPIEKNQGCNHMTCRPPCGFEFCWSCLGAWEEHKGSLYECNQYTRAMTEEDRGRDVLKKDLERYAHYYEQWASNEESKRAALVDLNLARNVYAHKLARIQGEPHVQLVFLIEAWEQIVECRRVLKWSYAYGYFILEDGSGKMRLFEHLQGEAERALVRLHHCMENELMEKYLKANGPLPKVEFNDFRCKLTTLTGVTSHFFENLVTALENNLSEVS